MWNFYKLASLSEYQGLKETLDNHIANRKWWEVILERWKPFCPHCHERTWWYEQSVYEEEITYTGIACPQCGLACVQEKGNPYTSRIYVRWSPLQVLVYRHCSEDCPPIVLGHNGRPDEKWHITASDYMDDERSAQQED